MKIVKRNKIKTELRLLILIVGALILSLNIISAVSQTISVNVVETKKLDLTFIPIDNPSDFDSNVQEFVLFFNKTYPIANNGLIINIDNAYSTSEKEKSSTTSLLFNIRKKLFVIPTPAIRKRVVGVLPAGWFLLYQGKPDTLGDSRLPPAGGTLFRSGLAEAVDMRQIAAHEIGHTFGLCDEYDNDTWYEQDHAWFVGGSCPNGDVDNDRVLDSNCDSSNGCPTSIIGKLVPWNGSSDFINMINFMGNKNQDETWISNESYIHLLDKFQESSPVVQNAVIVNGKINKTDETIELFTSYIIENAEITTQEENTTGNYSIEIVDNNDTITSEINFTPSFLDIDFNGTTVETNVSYFVILMNFSFADKIIRAKEINITKDQVNRTANTPSLQIISNLSDQNYSGELFNVTWNSSDLDGDSLNYAVLFSSDNGSNYITLEIDYNQTNITLNSANLEDCALCRIKVLATDGINTNSSVSDSFSIDTTPPNIEEVITINENGIVDGDVVQGENVTFNVTVTDEVSDVESVWLKIWEGVIDVSSVIWQGFLSFVTGDLWSVEVETNESFPVGNVNYTVYANDTLGNEGNVSGNFSVVLPDDTHKFYIKDSGGNAVAWLGNEGNIVLKGSCYSGGNCDSPGDGSFIIRNSSLDYVAYINSTGDLCLESGDCSDQSANCNNPGDGSFIIRNSTLDYVSYINATGDLCLIGRLYENADL